MSTLSSYSSVNHQPVNDDGNQRRRSMAFSTILPAVYSQRSSLVKHDGGSKPVTLSLPPKLYSFLKQPSLSMMEARSGIIQRPLPTRSLSTSTTGTMTTTTSSTLVPSGGGGCLSTTYLDHSHLNPGNQALLLSHADTIDMYQQNCKKTHHPEMICDFALFLIDAGAALLETDCNRMQYLHRAEKLLKQLAARGHPAPHYHLGTLYMSGLMKKGKQQLLKAFPYFLQAAKLHHQDACFRIAKCYEDGVGCGKDLKKAGQYYTKSALLYHPGGMFRLGVAKMNGELGLELDPEEGLEWLERSMEVATTDYPHAVHELGLLHEGSGGRAMMMVVAVDLGYALQLYIQAADQFGYAPSAYRLGECYEHGQLGCKVDLVLAIHYYTMAAQSDHAEACLALASWYLVGVPLVLDVSEYDAYVWAKRAAERGCVKAEYTMGYFTQVGIGCLADREMAKAWYMKAAQHGNPCAIHRLQNRFSPTTSGLSSIKLMKSRSGCLLM